MTWEQVLLTLVVATLVYRWQKSVDRQTMLDIELRKTYAQFLFHCDQRLAVSIHADTRGSSVKVIYSDPRLMNLPSQSPAFVLDIDIYAPNDIIEIAEEMKNAVWEAIKKFSQYNKLDDSEKSMPAFVEVSQCTEPYRTSRRKFVAAIKRHHRRHIGQSCWAFLISIIAKSKPQ